MEKTVNKFLIKFFDKEEYLLSFREGHIRMMSAYYYAHLKNDGLLYDNRYNATEGNSFLINQEIKDDYRIYKLGNSSLKLSNSVKRVCISEDKSNMKIKLSCFYELKRDNLIDGKFITQLSTMKDSLGEYYCLFTNPEAFSNRMETAILEQNDSIKKYRFDSVIYEDENKFTGMLDSFHSISGLYWQAERRLVLNTTIENDPFFLEIGDISDITIWGNKKDLVSGLCIDESGIIINNYKK